MPEAKSSTSGLTVALVAVLGVILLFGLYGVTSFVGAFNHGNTSEKTLQAALDHNKNVLSQYTTKIAEMAQVPAMQRNDLQKVIQSAFEGRYGENGSQAVFQAIKENYPGQLDNKLYERLQSTMEAGRNDFQAAQDQLIDRKRQYETELGSFPGGLWLHMAGYPKINLADIKVISNTHTEKAYDSGIDDGVQLPGATAASSASK